MSGFPLKSPTDAAKYRQIYMATLGLQAANDEKNLVANQLFKKTGEVPVQPPDTRTTAQKYQDIISMKNSALAALAMIMDGDQVRRAINQMTRGEVAFYLNYSPAINNDILSKMKLGITADTFIPYLRRYMRKEIDTQGVNYGLQQGTGEQLLMSLQQIANDMPSRVDLGLVARAVGHGVGGGGGHAHRLEGRELLDAIHELDKSLPTAYEVQQLYGTAEGADERDAMLRDLDAYFAELPSKIIIQRGLDDLATAEQHGDERAIGEALDHLRGLLTVREETLEGFQRLRLHLSHLHANNRERVLSPEEVEAGQYAMAEIPRDDDNDFGSTPVATSSGMIGSLINPLAGVLSSGSAYLGIGGGGGASVSQPQGGLALTNPVEIHPTGGGGASYSLSRDVSASSYDPETTEEAYTPQTAGSQSVSASENILQHLKDVKRLSKTDLNKMKVGEVRLYIKHLVDLEDKLHFDAGINTKLEADKPKSKPELVAFLTLPMIQQAIDDLLAHRKQIHGKGLRRKPRISGSGVKPAKVAPIERYGRIGDHIIKLQPLEKNILTINTPNGWAVKGLPSKTISSNLVNVFKEIVGEGVPKYSSIEDLTEGEKDFLNKIARITKIEDRVKVKTPTKTDLDKLVNRFEILKGEICAGNNSNELVKEFKKIIMTLSNEGMLPKGQAREILMDLVSLGF